MRTNHKFVNTTPKPRATKNRSGDEVGPVLGLFVGDGIVVGEGDDDRAFNNVLDAPLCANEVGVG